MLTVPFEPIPEDRQSGRQRQEVASMRLLRLPDFDPTTSKISARRQRSRYAPLSGACRMG
jgi:hypothetical protein